ncbi:hypothetical protein [Pseudoroseomonas ludipueritiae]
MALMVSICASCGGAFAAPLDICHACAALLSTAAIRRQPPEGAPARPVLRARDAVALQRLLHAGQRIGEAACRALRAKLDHACVAPPEAVPVEAACLGSRVTFSINGGAAQARVLVLPRDHSPAGWTLPVTAPRGLALLGESAGAVVTVQGARAAETLRLLAVGQQRDAEPGRTAWLGEAAG